MAATQVKKAKTSKTRETGTVKEPVKKKTAPKTLVKTAPPKPAPKKRKAKATPDAELQDNVDDLTPETDSEEPACLDEVDAVSEDAPKLEETSGEETWLVGSAAAVSEEKRRKAVVPPANAKTGMNLFDYLRSCTPPLDKKIVDIAIAQTGVPGELRGEAAQEILMVWSTIKPDLSRFKPGQIASYAHRMAKHTSLRIRRDLGSAVRLPGSAFRKRRDGSSYVNAGVLSVALDWNELEGWMDLDEASDGTFSASLAGSGSDDILSELGGLVEPYMSEDNEEEILKQRLHVLEKFKDKLTERQFQILMRLSRGDSYEEIQRALGIKKGVMMRELNLAACVIGPM